jgi:outer membrane murein-binding lipoprotein Lpp
MTPNPLYAFDPIAEYLALKARQDRLERDLVQLAADMRAAGSIFAAALTRILKAEEEPR